MTMNSPLVSVVIPTYARSQYICRAINSVLNQTYQNIEIIVVDDNGENTDNQLATCKMLKPYIEKQQIRYIAHKTNQNGSAARNTGIFNAKGEYICLLDDDDEFFPEKIEKQVHALNQLDDSWAGVFCNSINRFITPHGIKEQLNKVDLSRNLYEEFLFCRAKFGSSSLMLRKSVCLEIKGFDTSFKRHQDWEFLTRILRKYKLKQVEPDKALLFYYVYPQNINRPSGKQAQIYREHYLNKFKQDIESSPNKNKIYYKNYWDIGLALLSSFHFKESYSYFKKASNYCFPTIKDILRIILYLYRNI
jgi:glycosyltransferase involved in cell wall biosynthesis